MSRLYVLASGAAEEGWLLCLISPGVQTTFLVYVTREQTPYATSLCYQAGCGMHEWPRSDGWTPWGAWHLKISKCIASSLPRAFEWLADHHHSGVNTAVLICDICPALFYPRPSLAQEADGHLWGAGCLDETAPSLSATSWVSRCSQASGGCWNSTWRLHVWSSTD